MTKYLAKPLVIILLAALIIPTPVFATLEGEDTSDVPLSELARRSGVTEEDSDTDSRFQRLKEFREMTKEERESYIASQKAMRLDKRCKTAEENMNKRLDFYTENTDRHSGHYSGFITKLDNLVTKLTEAGYDASEVSIYKAELQALIDVSLSAKEDFLTELTVATTAACDEDRDAFKLLVQAAKDRLTELKDSHTATKDYVKNTVLPGLKILRENLKKNSTS